MAANADFIRSLYAAFGRGDISTILENLDQDITWSSVCDSDLIPWGGTRHGIAGAASFFQALSDNLDFESFEPRQFLEDGHAVVVLGHTRARLKRNAGVIESDWAHVFGIDNGRVAEFREFYDSAAIVAALAG